MEKELNKMAWKEAATGGLYLGLAYVALYYVGYFVRTPGIGAAVNAVTFFTIAGFLYAYARKVGMRFSPAAFSFGRSWLFALQMALFAGIMAGLGQFVLANWLDPQGYREQMDMVSAMMAENGLMSEEQAELAGEAGARLMRNPLVTAFSGIFSLLIYGGLIGLIVALFTKRPADPFAGEGGEGPRPV